MFYNYPGAVQSPNSSKIPENYLSRLYLYTTQPAMHSPSQYERSPLLISLLSPASASMALRGFTSTLALRVELRILKITEGLALEVV